MLSKYLLVFAYCPPSCRFSERLPASYVVPVSVPISTVSKRRRGTHATSDTSSVLCDRSKSANWSAGIGLLK